MQGFPLGLTVLCFGIGMLGSLFGAWFSTRKSAARLDASWQALEQDREKAQREMQLASLCVPQWVQQAVRLEFERLDNQQSQRWSELFREQLRWQAEQDALRRREWVALGGASMEGRLPQKPSPVPGNRPPVPKQPAQTIGPEPFKAPSRMPAISPELSGQQLSDAEIDALPPDLPAPVRLSGKKLPVPRGRVLRNI